MTIERGLRGIAGTFVVGSAILAAVQSPYWLLLTGFVGLNFVAVGIYKLVPDGMVIGAIGIPRVWVQVV